MGIANKTLNKWHSRSMNMHFFWILDQIQQKNFDAIWCPGQENLADYPTKHHPTVHHQRMHLYYIYTPKSPRNLPRALAPHILQGCVNSLQRHQMTYDRQTPPLRIGTRKVPLKNSCVTQRAQAEQTQLPAKLDNS
eukprot:9640371-Ditylum_brightwellii.AAC.1